MSDAAWRRYQEAVDALEDAIIRGQRRDDRMFAILVGWAMALLGFIAVAVFGGFVIAGIVAAMLGCSSGGGAYASMRRKSRAAGLTQKRVPKKEGP